MAKPLDFKKVKKPTWTVTLDDGSENGIVLLVKTPSKATWESILNLESELKNITGADLEAMDILYSVGADIMSNNKGGIKIAKEDLEECLDFTDMIIFFEGYIAFVQETIDSKN